MPSSLAASSPRNRGNARRWAAGAVGGLFYGFVGASQPAPQGVGGLSILLVLLGVTTLVALIGGAGVSIGIAAAETSVPARWPGASPAAPWAE